jgi:gamma-glutamyltranspeptidase / glutathione hydrolase
MSRGQGAVAAGHPVTAKAVAEVLADGGNAFDAVIAGLLAACVCEPVLASPGGGGFLAARQGGKVRHFDFFVAAPSRKMPSGEVEFTEIAVDFGTATQCFHVGAGSSATPGFVPGLFAVHETLGRMPMTLLAEPALRAARDGVTVTEFQAFLFKVVGPIYRWTKEAKALFAPEGDLPAIGDIFKNPDLADALEAIAREGVRIATEGEIGRAMADSAAAHGGHLSDSDLTGYSVELREPLVAEAAGWRIHLNPPPALGGALVTAMLRAYTSGAGNNPVGLARTIDAIDRHWREVPTDPAHVLGHPAPRPVAVAERGTTHISVVDAEGNAAAATVSNGEGNGRIVPGCGFMLNNMLGEEDLNPGGFHQWLTGQRLGSMMTPGRSMEMPAIPGAEVSHKSVSLSQRPEPSLRVGSSSAALVRAVCAGRVIGRLGKTISLAALCRHGEVPQRCDEQVEARLRFRFGGLDQHGAMHHQREIHVIGW